MSTLGYHLNLVSCRLQAVSYIVFNPLSPNGDQHQFSLNNIICMRCQENREEKCYVKLPWYPNLWMTTKGPRLSNDDGNSNENSKKTSIGLY